jgi:hypothetical protein
MISSYKSSIKFRVSKQKVVFHSQFNRKERKGLRQMHIEYIEYQNFASITKRLCDLCGMEKIAFETAPQQPSICPLRRRRKPLSDKLRI